MRKWLLVLVMGVLAGGSGCALADRLAGDDDWCCEYQREVPRKPLADNPSADVSAESK